MHVKLNEIKTRKIFRDSVNLANEHGLSLIEFSSVNAALRLNFNSTVKVSRDYYPNLFNKMETDLTEYFAVNYGDRVVVQIKPYTFDINHITILVVKDINVNTYLTDINSLMDEYGFDYVENEVEDNFTVISYDAKILDCAVLEAEADLYQEQLDKIKSIMSDFEHKYIDCVLDDDEEIMYLRFKPIE